MSRNHLAIVALLAFLGALLSGLLLLEHHGVGPAKEAVHALCGAEEASGCELVSQSRYSSVGAFSLASVGLVFYASVLFLLALGLASSEVVRESVAAAALVLFALALVVDVILLGIQAFALGAYCRLCLATYGVNLVSLIVLLPARVRIASSFAAADARRSLAVWALGSFVLVVGIGAFDRVLDSVRASDPEALLGASGALLEDPGPAPPGPAVDPAPGSIITSSPGPSPPSSGDETARLRGALQAAEARIQELQSTLDDPQKYQDYQAKKAAEDFERETPLAFDLQGIPFKGPAEAPIRVVEFSDFLCPYCRNLASAFNGYLQQSQGRVAIYFKNYPLDQACNPGLTRTIHDGACELALGAVCAEEQGKFWPYHDRIFAQPPSNPSNEDVVRFATEAGLDGDAMRRCLPSSSARAKLDRDIEDGRRVEVTATPTVFVNGKRLQQIGGFLQAIELESKRLGLSSPEP